MAAIRGFTRPTRKLTTFVLVCVLTVMAIWSYSLQLSESRLVRPLPVFLHRLLAATGGGISRREENVWDNRLENAGDAEAGNDTGSRSSVENNSKRINAITNSKSGNPMRRIIKESMSRAKVKEVSVRTSSRCMNKTRVAQHPHRHQVKIDHQRRRLRVWSEEGGLCGELVVKFAREGSLPPSALVSYPGSGNTWTRHLLQAATGVFTGSIYRDQELYMKGFFGELEPWNAGTTFTQKTHECSPSHIESFNGTGILLLRNPYHAIISYHNFLFGGHTGYAPISNYRRKDWGAFVHLQARSWLELAINWITRAKAMQVLHYENLKEDAAEHLFSVLDFFGFPCDLQRLECLQSHENLSFKRKEVFIPENLEIFSEKVRDKVDRAVRYVDYLLKKHNHHPLPLHLYEFYNNTPSHQLITVACLAGETGAVCDERVDRRNLAKKRKKMKKTKKNKKNENSISVISATNVKKQQGKGKEKPDSLERFTSTKVGWFLTQMFNNIMRYTRADPITRMLGDSQFQDVQQHHEIHQGRPHHPDAT